MTIDWEKYSAVAFIDSNVALECLALEQLPWREIKGTGIILVLVVPTVLQEVDSKKSHARLGDHARRFNKTLRPLLAGNQTVAIRSTPAPQVEVALAVCRPVEWDNFPDFDREEADARVAVQAQCAQGPAMVDRVLVSHDTRPLALAQQLGLRVHQIGDNWLRPKEISEAEKKVAKLQRDLESIKSREPKLEISFATSAPSVSAYRIKDLSTQEREDIQSRIISLNPKTMQERIPGNIHSSFDFDASLGRRYDQWENELIPNFIKNYERNLEWNFSQIEISFCLKNVGEVPAEGLLIRLTATGGWFNDRYVLVSPAGPYAPSPRQRNHDLLQGMYSRDLRALIPGKHEFVVVEVPKRSTQVQVACQDFRHGYDYTFKVFAWVDPRASGLSVAATVTASNLHGALSGQMGIAPNTKEVAVSEIIDLNTMKFFEPPPAALILAQAMKRDDYNAVEIVESNWSD